MCRVGYLRGCSWSPSETVQVITTDGRVLVVCFPRLFFRGCAHVADAELQGLCRGFDQVINVILETAEERVFSSDEGVEFSPLGLYVVRGDTMCVAVAAVDVVLVQRCARRGV